VHGLPWTGRRLGPQSHGTWGIHNACQTLQKLKEGALDCATCGPEPGSRTDRALADQVYYLYLVRYRRIQKFGVGGRRRVYAHVAQGARVVQVLTGRREDVKRAELALKRQLHTRALVGKRSMPITFGEGTEVIRARIRIDLTAAFPGGKDVTARFAGNGTTP
jgi:hypothetical protein